MVVRARSRVTFRWARDRALVSGMAECRGSAGRNSRYQLGNLCRTGLSHVLTCEAFCPLVIVCRIC